MKLVFYYAFEAFPFQQVDWMRILQRSLGWLGIPSSQFVLIFGDLNLGENYQQYVTTQEQYYGYPFENLFVFDHFGWEFFDYLKNFFANYIDYFNLPEQYPKVKTPWLAFPLVIRKNKLFNRKNMQIFFEKNKIQTRTIFTGNILRQPVMKNRIFKKNPKCDKTADDVMRNGILIGCHQGMVKSDLDYICKTFKRFINL